MVLKDERRALGEIWDEFWSRTWKSRIIRVMLLGQLPVALFFIISVQRWLWAPWDAPVYQSIVIGFYLVWSDLPDKLVKYKIPIIVQLVGLVLWIIALDATIRHFVAWCQSPYWSWNWWEPAVLVLTVDALVLQLAVFVATVRHFLTKTRPNIHLE